MIRNILLLTVLLAFAGCSSSGSDNEPAPSNPDPQTPATGNPTPVDQTPGTTQVEPSGTTAGVWTGPTDFGTGVYVIDSAQNLFGFSSNGLGQFKSLFGPIDGLIERFDHRSGDNPTLGGAPTIVGDPDAEFASLSYLFALTDDARNLFNTSALGEFTMALADDNSITIADIAGDWESKTSFCATCPLQLNMNIAADGTLSGNTSFGEEGALDPVNNIPLSGSVSGGGQFLEIEFSWDGKIRSGVVYREFGTEQLMLNTVGVESAEDGNRAFSALLSRSSTGAPVVIPPDTNTDPGTGTPPVPQATNATGTWTGPSDFGTGVYIIDDENNLFGFSADGGGKFKSLFGPIDGLIERFDHRTGDNTELGDAYTIVGDPDAEFANLSYQFTLAEDGGSLTNSSALGDFTMTLAGDNSITIADAVGSWESRTSFCNTCPLVLTLNILADGSVTGNTVFGEMGTVDPANTIPLNGTLTEAGQYLGFSFNWDGKLKTGVVYRDIGTQKLVVNTFGAEPALNGNRAFSALLTPLP